MAIQFRTRQRTAAAITAVRPGLLLKRLVLVIGAVYFTMVAVTNTVNFIAAVGGFHWTFLNSGNAAYIASIIKVYSWPAWTTDAAVLAAALAEGFGAFLFARALLRYRGGRQPACRLAGAELEHRGLAGLHRGHRVLRGLHVRRPVP